VRSNPAPSPDDFDTLIERHKSQPVSYGVFGEAFNVLLDTMTDAMKTEKGRSAALEARVAQLEQQPPSPHYQGVFQEEKTYSRGSMVTKGGGLWLALEDTTRVPGRSADWRLVVKSGEAPR
jgi:hypothetical protein